MKCKRCGKYTDNPTSICDECAAAPMEDILSRSDGKVNTTSDVGKFVDFNSAANSPRDRIRLKKSKNDIKLAVRKFSVALLITAVAAGVIYGASKFVISITPSGKIYSALESGDTAKAETIFKENFTDGDGFLLSRLLEKRLDEAYEDYSTGEISYEKISSEYKAIANMSGDDMGEKVKNATTRLETMKKSKTAYNLGLDEYKMQNYGAAIEAFKAVLPEDIYYEEAQNKLRNAVMVYRNDVLTKAADYVTAGEYKKAITHLKSAKGLEDDELVKRRISDYERASAALIRKTAVNTADTFSFKSDYATAIKILETAMDENPILKEDKTMVSNLKHYRDLFSEQFKEKMDEYVKNGDYDSAGELLHAGQLLIPTSEEVAIKEAELKGKVPIYLDTLTGYNKKSWNFSKGSAIDASEIDHASDENYIVISEKSTASYSVSGTGYKTFSCSATASKKMKANKSCRLKVTAIVGGDYHYKEYEITPENGTTSVSVNVSGCSDVVIEVEGKGAKAILSNLKFKY